MEQRVNEMDPELTIPRLDGGGIPIFHYKRKPFTGIVYKYHKDGKTLAVEKEYEEGYQEGYVRYYHLNGRMSEEYFKHNNIAESGKVWDENGNLTDSWD